MGVEKKSLAISRKKLDNQSTQEIRQKTTKTVAKAPPSLRSQMEGIFDPLTHQDLAIFSWAFTLGHPWTLEPAGVPAIAGSAVVRTSKAQVIYEIPCFTGTDGFGFCCLSLDGWTSAYDPVSSSDIYSAYNGGTQGYPIWFTVAGYAGTNFPGNGATTGTAGLARAQQSLIDPSLGQYQRMRLVAAGLRAFSTAPESTAQGKIAIISTSRPSGQAADGAIASSSYATLSSLPEDIIHFKTQAITGTGPKDILSTFAVPCGDSCFDMFSPVATGKAVFWTPQLACVVSGGSVSQSFTVQIVMDYEFTMATGHLTGTAADPILPQSTDVLKQVASLFPSRVESGPSGHAGSAAFVNYLAHTAPNKIRQLAKPLSLPEGNLISKSGSFVGRGLAMVKNLVSMTPWSNLAKTGLSFLSKLF